MMDIVGILNLSVASEKWLLDVSVQRNTACSDLLIQFSTTFMEVFHSFCLEPLLMPFCSVSPTHRFLSKNFPLNDELLM